jgi:glutathione peroxidase-family protein
MSDLYFPTIDLPILLQLEKQCLAKYSNLVVRIPAADINGVATHPVYARLKNLEHIKII